MYTPVDVVKVSIWGQLVGAVARDPQSGAYVFEYDRQWRTRGVELSPLHMRTASPLHVSASLPEETFKRLPAMLADSLPDDFGNALIDAALARQGVSKTQISPLDRLAYMGNRSMGALEFKPIKGPRGTKQTAIELSNLVQGARATLQGRFSGDVETEAAIQNIFQVFMSAGGARAKAVVAFKPSTQEIRFGQIRVDTGFEYWLLKLDGVGKDLDLGTGRDYGRIEYAYHLMARAAGIEMSDCSLLEENGRAHFMTRRFDRVADRKHHVQTLCAMSHLDYKQRATHDYNQLFLTCLELQLSVAEMQEVFRRMAFNVIAANCDDHTKNFAFLLREGEAWRLAPAYDVTHAYIPTCTGTCQHQMSVNGKFSRIAKTDLLQVADRFKVPAAKAIFVSVRDAVAKWESYADKADLAEVQARRVRNDFQLLD